MINTSRQIVGPVGIVVLLAIATLATPHVTGQIIIPSTAAMVTGFGYAFLTAALITGIGIVIAFSFKHQKPQQQQNNEDKLKMS
ncbi:MAG: hypothetical protein ACTHJ7_00930 [Candidatus Nitrosocosmicus sp.]